MQCPACQAEAPDDDLFCEACGQRLAVSASAPASAAEPGHCLCGAPLTEADEEGFCLRCGRRVRRPPTDHIELPVSASLAAVSDRGLRHDRNEDRVALAELQPGACAMVVCDGVSASRHSEEASAAVSAATLSSLAAADLTRDPEALLREALAAGAAQLEPSFTAAAGGANTGPGIDPGTGSGAAAGNPADDAPSTTVVAALVLRGQATVAWVGDSRAYWFDQSGARPLTHDHSWLNEVVTAGEMSAEQAARSPEAHAITRWLGADSAGNSGVDVVHQTLAGPGLLLLCTDGLWNYAPTPAEMGALLRETDAPEALTQCRALVGFALGRGGQDNITVALLRVPAPEPVAPGTAEAQPS